MAGQYKAEDFIEAIPGTGGIISSIAKKVGCTWNTAQKFIKEHPTVKQAYDDECEGMLDLSETVILSSIKSGDSGDAKWYLSRKGKERGYAERIEQDLNPDNKPLIVNVNIDSSKL